MQIVSTGDNLHEMSNPVFPGLQEMSDLHEMLNPVFLEKWENINLSAELAQRVV